LDKKEEVIKTLKRINSLIEKDKDVEIVEDLKEDGNYFSGKIEVNFLNESLFFQIKIPHHYPLTHPNSDNISIIFRNSDLIGLNHINPDGSVCFHPDKDDDLDRKLVFELKCLKQWISDYYINRKEEDNYTYLIHDTEEGRIDRLYFTNTYNDFKKGAFGGFKYSIFSNERVGEKKIPVKKMFRLEFENGNKDSWSTNFILDLNSKTCKNGIYYYLDEEPLIKGAQGRNGAKNWDDFENYFTDEFLEFLYKGLRGGFSRSYFYEKDLFIIVGYKIPNEERYEDHWDLIRITKNRNPIDYIKLPKSQPHKDKRFYYSLKTHKILWGGTENIDYERFFGRGKLNKQITDSKVLIIGCGAIGSTLAELLVRGGVKNIILEDFDNLRGGNLSRANYDLYDLIYFKTSSLSKRLKSISPFVNVNTISIKLNNYDIEQIEQVFNEKIDIIFDCSTDPEVTFIIDKIDFKGEVFSYAITNNAKSFVSITGKKLTNQAKVIFDYLENDPPTYIEGAGCGYPTFEANFNDISSLLNLGLKTINSNFTNSFDNKTLIIIPNMDKQKSINIEEYGYYHFEDLNSSIHLPISVLEKIKKITRQHYPNEFGGVFVGYKSKKNFIISDILIPDEYQNGRTIFIRDPGTLNQRLKDLHSSTGGKIEYLGEWHSHPDGPTDPSETDFKAMMDISIDELINIDTPLLMIAEVGESLCNHDMYVFHEKRFKKYE